MKVIKESKEFHISIKDVIYANKKRNFSNTGIPSRIRASKGTKIHQLYQKDQEKNKKSFQHEVLVKLKTKVQGWNFVISGRADITYESKRNIAYSCYCMDIIFTSWGKIFGVIWC
ncbi:MAG: hypothetical protein ACTSQ1_08310 [Promethearchaeota archaeon]